MSKRLLAWGASACALGFAVLTPGSAAAADTWSFQAMLNPVTANKVTGTGASWITVTGSTAEVQIQVNGLLDGSPHAQHLYIDALGRCPAEPVQRVGQPSVTAGDGAGLFGSVGASLTTAGDTSAAAALALAQSPSAGSYTYSRTVELDPAVIDNLARGTAVLVVHGIDYDGSGSYNDALGASDLDPTLPAEATNPALCGTYEPMQMAAVPAGAADTGGGSTAAGADLPGIGLAGAGIAGAGIAGLTALVLGRGVSRPRWRRG
jgi:hypothetical protein